MLKRVNVEPYNAPNLALGGIFVDAFNYYVTKHVGCAMKHDDAFVQRVRIYKM